MLGALGVDRRPATISTISVPGMMCGGCASAVTSALSLPGVVDCSVDLTAKRVFVTAHADGPASEELITALEASGKEATLISRTEISPLRVWAGQHWHLLVVATALVPPSLALMLRGGGGGAASGTGGDAAGGSLRASLIDCTNNLVASRAAPLAQRLLDLFRKVSVPLMRQLPVASSTSQSQ